MEPLLDRAPYGHAVWPGRPLPFAPLATLTEAEGLTAAFVEALSAEGIICKVIAGHHHDHIFVHGARREDPVAGLRRLLNA